MSSPTSARMTCAIRKPMPGISSSRSSAGNRDCRTRQESQSGSPQSHPLEPEPPVGGWASGMAAINSSIRVGERDDLTIQAIDLVQQHPGQLGVVVIEPASQCLDQLGVLGFHLAAGQAGQLTRVAFSGDMRFDHAPRRQRGDGP
ncbi:hypothetical protein ACTMTI_50595 [Nonomuraea sp. H19]|uniref:hypothetical protein n=1 Tax=Nonomuraea sp. H19 TaxID=3452206 RepID=UPI003F8B306E